MVIKHNAHVIAVFFNIAFMYIKYFSLNIRLLFIYYPILPYIPYQQYMFYVPIS